MRSVRLVCWFVIFCLFLILGSTTPLTQSNAAQVNSHAKASNESRSLSQPKPETQGRILQSYGKLPLSFESNQGQADPQVKFVSRGSGYTLFLTGDEAVFSLHGGERDKAQSPVALQAKPRLRRTSAGGPRAPDTALRMKLLNANPAAQVAGDAELPGKSNYFLGNDPQKWRTNVPTYAKVKYKGVYSGIDLVYYGNQGQLEYDFVVAPHADPRHIAFGIEGAKSVHRDAHGDLVLQFGGSEVRWRKPVVYQEKDGARQEIAGRYVIRQGNQIGFEVAGYDASRPLIVDPTLVYSTYLGGTGDDRASSVAMDSSGNAYITGFTDSTDFPTKNPVQKKYGGGTDAFVTKINAAGTALVYSTYLGGSDDDEGRGIAVDTSGNAYIAGVTLSTNFPVVNPLQGYGGNGDAFVTKLNADGSALTYSTYLGGSMVDDVNSIAVSAYDNAYVIGSTESTDFPTTQGAFQTKCGGASCSDAFVTEFSSAGSTLVYSTYLGGSAYEWGAAIALDPSGNAYVAGFTTSDDFPVTIGAFQTQHANDGGQYDAFVTEFNAQGSALVYSTYLGGAGSDVALGIAVDGSGDAYVTGATSSKDFPTKNAFQRKYRGGGDDAFVTKLNPAGSALVYSSFLGGTGEDAGQGMGLDSSGNAYVVGFTASTNFPTKNPFQGTYGGGYYDAFVTELNSAGSVLVYSTYLGGEATDSGNGIAVAASTAGTSGGILVVGDTLSTDFPTLNPLQNDHPGDFDAFVAKFSRFPAVSLSPPSLDFAEQKLHTTSKPKAVTLTNTGEADLHITNIAASGDFAETNNCPVNGSLAPGKKCEIDVTFTPTQEGTRNGDVTITDDALNSPQNLPLTGIGAAPLVSLSPPNLDFGNQTVNIPSSPKTTTLTNTGNIALHITSIAVTGANSGDFAESDNCGKPIPPNGSCEIKVTFTPSTTGTRSAQVTITDDAPDSPQHVPLSGVGVLPAVEFSPKSLTFPTQLVYTSSPAHKVTLTNTGKGILLINSLVLKGQFVESNDCGKQVQPAAHCTISVKFHPRDKGPLQGTVTLTDNAPDSPQNVPLKGTGTFVELVPRDVHFGTQPVGTRSLPKTITLTNKGGSAVNIQSILITGADAGEFAETNNCGNQVASGGSCQIKVTFEPSRKGMRTASVSISDDGGGSPQQVKLTGFGT